MMIEWDPVEVLTCLEVEPGVDEARTSYLYAVEQEELVVALQVWPYDSAVWLAICRANGGEMILDLRMEGCRGIRYVRDDGGEALYFASFDSHSCGRVSIPGGVWLQVRSRVVVRVGHGEGGRISEAP